MLYLIGHNSQRLRQAVGSAGQGGGIKTVRKAFAGSVWIKKQLISSRSHKQSGTTKGKNVSSLSRTAVSLTDHFKKAK